MSFTITAPAKPRSPWQRFYSAGHRWRRRYWTSRASVLPKPVVSIGNLSWGGTGKTPMTAAVAAFLRDSGRRVAILSRGYGSKGEGVRIVSRGEGPLLGPRLGGDEPVLLAGLLPGVSVVVCPDRALAGRHALERLDEPPDVFLLDDGFSHLRLARDVEILLFPSGDPFAGGRLPPGGRLREPLEASGRADAAVLTSHLGDASAGEALARALRPHGFSGRGFVASVKTQPARPYLPAAPSIESGSPVFVVAAIARPERLVENVLDQGFNIVDQLTFPDHHPYPDESLEKVAAAFDASGAEWVLTTSKDLVKLQGRLERPLAEMPIEAQPEPDFFDWLERRLAKLEATGDAEPRA
ncbi:MAG: tetraacyldisaccharide 4'-kinase [Acidobacteriota bacterium]